MRYRPASPTQVEAHRTSLAALLADVADLPEHVLERATERWVRSNKFLPRSSELIALCQQLLTASGEARPLTKEQRAAEWNQELRAQGKYHMEWFVENDSLRLRATGQ